MNTRARHNGQVKWVVANVVLLSSCVFRLSPSYQWWQIQNIRSCIMWPRVASGSRLCLSSGVFNHCYNPSQFLLPGVSSHRPLTIKLSLMITHHHPSLSQSSCSGYSQSEGTWYLRWPMRGQKTVSMAWSSCATMRVMEEGEKWWYINMSMHLSAPLKPTWTNRVMGQFKT